jgi:hypothetical protein
MTQTVDLGRGSRTSVYIEPELYEQAMKLCVESGKSYSHLMRGLLLKHLIEKGKLPEASIAKLLGM